MKSLLGAMALVAALAFRCGIFRAFITGFGDIYLDIVDAFEYRVQPTKPREVGEMAGLRPEELRCEYRKDPLGIEVPDPASAGSGRRPTRTTGGSARPRTEYSSPPAGRTWIKI